MNHILRRDWHLDRIVSVFALLLMGGCAELNSIYRSQTLPDNKPHVVSIDAKQRVILSNVSKTTANNPKTAIVRFCAEPPPDVFTALASSLGAEASFSKSVSPELAAKMAVTMSENAATIERTQTINILREAMYRNCERYLSGAITEDEFIVQAARDQQLIVQILAVEQITGVAKAQSTALTTIARAAAGGISDASLTMLANAKKDIDIRSKASAEVMSEANKLPPTGGCGTSPMNEASPPSGVTADQAKAKNTKCAEAATAAKQAKESEEHYALIKETVAKQGSVSSEAQGQLASAAFSSSKTSMEIANKVVEIVRQYKAFDEIDMTCVVKLRKEKEPPDYCKKLLEQIAKTREAELALKMQEASLHQAQLGLEEAKLDSARVKLLRTEMDTKSLSEAELVWKKLESNVTPTNLKVLANKAGLNSRGLSDLVVGNDFQKFIKEFKRLPTDEQEKLARAASQP